MPSLTSGGRTTKGSFLFGSGSLDVISRPPRKCSHGSAPRLAAVGSESLPISKYSLMRHLGGYQRLSLVGEAANFCLIRVRPERPLISGCATLAYLSTSQ